jgi:hypothetical protein
VPCTCMLCTRIPPDRPESQRFMADRVWWVYGSYGSYVTYMTHSIHARTHATTAPVSRVVAGWPQVPCTCMLCTRIPPDRPESQRFMANRVWLVYGAYGAYVTYMTHSIYARIHATTAPVSRVPGGWFWRERRMFTPSRPASITHAPDDPNFKLARRAVPVAGGTRNRSRGGRGQSFRGQNDRDSRDRIA